MTKQHPDITILNVTPDNVEQTGIYCIKDKKSPGYKSKVEWFKARVNNGIKMKIAFDDSGRQVGFIEYMPAEIAWRPVKADNYYFVQCIGVFVKEAKEKGVGSYLLAQCEAEARQHYKAGICAMSSDGPWMANKSLYEKSGFVLVEELDRFELMVKAFQSKGKLPAFTDWTKEQKKYAGWNLVYADQCPWHEKSVSDLRQCAADNGIQLNVIKLTSPAQARKAPSGFGTFSLIRDGRLLGDHYLSKTRFENILRKELQG